MLHLADKVIDQLKKMTIYLEDISFLLSDILKELKKMNVKNTK